MLECHGGRPGEALEQNKVDTRQKRIHVEIEDRLHWWEKAVVSRGAMGWRDAGLLLGERKISVLKLSI